MSIILTNGLHSENKSDPLTNQEKKITIDSISNKLQAVYVFPDVAKEMSDMIVHNLKKGNYGSINNYFDFASQLTKDLLSICHDKHLSVNYDPEGITTQKKVQTIEDSSSKLKYINSLKRENFGFKEVKILEGNIGYLDLRSFSDVEYAGETAVATMNFLSNSDAIIIDLRMNRGGSPAMIQLISSYLFSSEPIHLNDFYWRPTDTHSQTWTLPHVPGNRSPKTAVYILTSKQTFSAAEEFSYNLKNLKRATLIGETTGGGAHPVSSVNATDKFVLRIPSGRAINPITNTNWEGIGVSPHVDIPSNQALKVAHLKALKILLEESEDIQEKKFYEWSLKGLNALLEPVIIEKAILKSYIGIYGPRKISLEGNKLYYQRDENNKCELIPLSYNEFLLENINSLRIKFVIENGEVTGLEGHYDNGYSNHNSKNKK